MKPISKKDKDKSVMMTPNNQDNDPAKQEEKETEDRRTTEVRPSLRVSLVGRFGWRRRRRKRTFTILCH